MRVVLQMCRSAFGCDRAGSHSLRYLQSIQVKRWQYINHLWRDTTGYTAVQRSNGQPGSVKPTRAIQQLCTVDRGKRTPAPSHSLFDSSSLCVVKAGHGERTNERNDAVLQWVTCSQAGGYSEFRTFHTCACKGFQNDS